MARQTVAVALPSDELAPVERELAAAGYDVVPVASPEEFGILLESRRDFALAVLDGERDFDQSLEYYSLLHDNGRDIPALMVVSPRNLEQLSATTINDEYFTRPYSADSLRWRVEAMLIRAHTVDDGKGPIIESDNGLDSAAWTKRATVVCVFNPKGGVGKTTISINLAATLQVRRGQRVLLVDADTVTGHIANSLGLDQVQTVDDAWEDDRADGNDFRTLAQLATHHPNGLEIAVLTTQPLDSGNLDPVRVAEALSYSRKGYDFIIVDMHPSYGPVNRAIFERADRILVPITPDVPALRAGVQLSEPGRRAGRPRQARHGRQPGEQWRLGRRHGTDRRDARDGPHPIGRPALRPGCQRRPCGRRAVPTREGDRGLRRAGRPPARDRRRQGARVDLVEGPVVPAVRPGQGSRPSLTRRPAAADPAATCRAAAGAPRRSAGRPGRPAAGSAG